MAKLYAQAVMDENNSRTFETVPSKLKTAVAEILLSKNRADLVPVEYGGTLE